MIKKKKDHIDEWAEEQGFIKKSVLTFDTEFDHFIESWNQDEAR